jgi:glycosyltransferase involved in cell wall biosynthesis
MKVLVIFPDSISTPTGGLGVQFKNIHSRLKNKIDFYVAGYPDGPNGVDNYVGVYHPIPSIKHGSVNTLLGHTIYLAEALKFPKPDVVHAYDWSTYFAGVYLAQIHNVPLLLSMQLSANAMVSAGITNCYDFNTVDGYWLHKAHVETEWFGLQKADKIINVSKGYAKYFPQFSNKTTIIPNGIDLKDWQPTDKVKLPGDRKHKIVYIGRFSLMKSTDVLLDAEIPEDVDLIFVGSYNGGDHACVSKLEKTIGNKPGFHYYGPVYEQDKVNLLHSADAVIMPSKHEPFGIVALEALASKNVLIASRVDGLGDFLNDDNSINCGLTAEDMSAAMHKFTQLSDLERENMIENGLKTCEQYKWDEIAEEYYEVYKSML